MIRSYIVHIAAPKQSAQMFRIVATSLRDATDAARNQIGVGPEVEPIHISLEGEVACITPSALAALAGNRDRQQSGSSEALR